MNLLDLMGSNSPCGKTSPASSASETMPSDVSWERLSEANKPSYSLVGEHGQTLVWFPDHGVGLRGGFSTLNISAWPNDASVCSLSQVLEPLTPPRYSLSAKACRGILRRAENRKKKLPELLARALKAVAG
jgi:hypothetical protein